MAVVNDWKKCAQSSLPLSLSIPSYLKWKSKLMYKDYSYLDQEVTLNFPLPIFLLVILITHRSTGLKRELKSGWKVSLQLFVIPNPAGYVLRISHMLFSHINSKVKRLHLPRLGITYNLVVGNGESNWNFMTYHEESRANKLIGNFNVPNNKCEEYRGVAES